MNLSPEIIKMREALLERIGDKPLKEVAQIVNEILLNVSVYIQIYLLNRYLKHHY